MNMWKILGIEPTTDKRAIKRAYAAKTKETHPEEKPEEFKRLYEAYQAALGFADYVRRVEQSGGSVTSFYRTDEDGAESTEESAGDIGAARTGEADAADEGGKEAEVAAAPKGDAGQEKELLSYFEENQEKQDRRADDFLKYWQALESPYRNPWELDMLKEYLFSAKFQDVRYHARVLETLADEMNDKFFYGINEVKLLFWDAYGFQEGEETAYRGDMQRLWKCLYPAYERRKQALEEEQRRIKQNKITRVIICCAAAAILAAVLLSFGRTGRQREDECRFLADYMEKQYSGTSFSEPEHIGKDGINGDNVYTLRSSAHPEMTVTATVMCRYADGEKIYRVREDYGRQLFGYYAKQYGLTDEWVSEHNAIIYTDIGEIDEICEKAEKMFREQEELQKVTEIAFYTEQVLFPEILFLGGSSIFQFGKSQIYDFSLMTAEEISAQIREAYMVYMFQYESWHITTAQYREWGAAYEKKCKEWENDDGEWLEVDDPDSGECLCRLFVSTHERLDMYYSGDGTPAPMHTRMMTVGNAWHFLREQGADISVDENGREFYVKYYGTKTWFGYEPEVEFNDLRRCY